MKVVFTDDAFQDLDDIAVWLAANYPAVASAIGQRIEAVVSRIGRWPYSARIISSRTGVRAVPLGRYPYVIFYRIHANTVEILHIHHAAQSQSSGAQDM